MQIIHFERDAALECRFRQHYFELERETENNYSYGNWYMIVKTDAGEVVCDGWIDDSSGYTAKTAMEHACLGADIEPPKRWPREAL